MPYVLALYYGGQGERRDGRRPSRKTRLARLPNVANVFRDELRGVCFNDGGRLSDSKTKRAVSPEFPLTHKSLDESAKSRQARPLRGAVSRFDSQPSGER